MIVDEAARIIDGMPVPAAGILTVDPAHSSIGFHVRHLMIAKATGRFTTFSGTIHVEADPEEAIAGPLTVSPSRPPGSSSSTLPTPRSRPSCGIW